MRGSHQLVTCFSQLEVGRRRCKFINENVHVAAQPSIFVSLQIRLKIFFGEAFVNLRDMFVNILGHIV